MSWRGLSCSNTVTCSDWKSCIVNKRQHNSQCLWHSSESVSKNYKPLDSGRLNTMRCELGTLELILLDEVSMVGNSISTVQLNNHLKDLKCSKDDFGGVSITTLNDLFQLKPVMDSLCVYR